MDTTRFPELIKTIYDAVNKLEEMFTDAEKKKRHFTPDGHMVGSIGEALAAYHYGINLSTASTKTHDGEVDGRLVQIKATQGEGTKGKKISIYNSSTSQCPDHLLVLLISPQGKAKEIYNGPCKPVWDELVKGKRSQKNGQCQIYLSKLQELMKRVPDNEKIIRIHP